MARREHILDGNAIGTAKVRNEFALVCCEYVSLIRAMIFNFGRRMVFPAS
jgi:hypothetical protein